MYRDARKAAGLSIEEACFQLHVATRTLINYEAGETNPPPEVVLTMSHEYRRPEMTQVYCREHCAIGQAYSYDVLNAVNLDPASVMLKLMGEMNEAQGVLQQMLGLVVNKNAREDFSPAQWMDFCSCLHEFLDVEHNIETLKIALGKWCDVSELIREHNLKCRQRGYVQKERPLRTAAR